MSPSRASSPRSPRLALILSGGGARAAYQVGFLSYLAKEFPDVVPPILTGVSAGAVNAAYLASHVEAFPDRVHGLSRLWMDLEMADVFRVDARHLTWQVSRWGLQLVSGGARARPGVQGLVDTEPLRRLLHRVLEAEDGRLPGVAHNLETGVLDAFALTTTSYGTGRSVTWVQASEGSHIQAWERAHRRSVTAPITVEHVMASAALPLFFPAVRLDRSWYGDGGIRLTAPLSPAVHLGADRILAISTRYVRSPEEAEEPLAVPGYPPPAQVAGVLLNAVFLDLLDGDALRLQRINELVAKLPPDQRGGMRHVDLLILRPSLDLGLLASEYEIDLPRAFRFLVRGLGTHQTRSADALSLILFQPGYLRRLVALGETDARARREEIAAFLGVEPQVAPA